MQTSPAEAAMIAASAGENRVEGGLDHPIFPHEKIHDPTEDADNKADGSEDDHGLLHLCNRKPDVHFGVYDRAEQPDKGCASDDDREEDGDCVSRGHWCNPFRIERGAPCRPPNGGSSDAAPKGKEDTVRDKKLIPA